ncbi:MAG: ZIP family zinc transporter [Luteibaculaceae bacterium]|jgi:ZIP family zinc transporter
MIFVVLILTFFISSLGSFVQKGVDLNKYLLRFSGAFFLAMVFSHYLPESYSSGSENIGLWVVLGFVFQLILDFFSKGVEHGHMHSQDLVSVQLWLALSVHSFVEGAALEVSQNSAWLFGIIIHKIPVAFLLGFMVKKLDWSKFKKGLLLLGFACATPFGYGISTFFKLDVFAPEITALSAGLLMHVSTIILFEGDKNHKFEWKKSGVVFLGIICAVLL